MNPFISLLMWLAVAARVAGSPPSFLVLVADDMRADAIHAHGDRTLQTPVLDRLIAQGFSFREAHCMGSNSGAVCIPSRAMLLTGRGLYRIRNDLAGQETLPQILGERGYETFIAGKWHNGAAACERSFQRGEAVFLGGMTDQFHPNLATLTNHTLGPAHRSESFSTDAIARGALQFLQHRDGTKPFFAWVSFTVPHDPRTPKGTVDRQAVEATGAPTDRAAPASLPSFATLYEPEKIALPPNFLPQHPFDNGWMTVRDEELLGWPRDAAAVRREWAAYHGLITHLDARIGDLLDALGDGRAGPTYVIFLSDHGLALGSHGLLGKQNLYEHSMRAPLIIRGPGVPAGRESRALVYLHDLHATVLDLAGVELTDHSAAAVDPVFHSRSLAPIWRDDAATIRDHLILSFTDTMRAVRTDRWKLIRYPGVDVTQLFDLDADPHEITNLAGNRPEKVAELRRVLEERQREAEAPLPWTATPTKPAPIDLTGRPANPAAIRPWEKH